MIPEPRDASTVVLVRDRNAGQGPPEALLVRRHAKANFAPGAYVFPGGMLEESDYSDKALALSTNLTPQQAMEAMEGLMPAEKALGFHLAVIRETFEEVGVLLARTPDGNWWRPEGIQREEAEAARHQMYDGKLDFYQWVREHGVTLATEELVYFAHWITPEVRPKRFDTRFFLVEVPSELEVITDRKEVFDHTWVTEQEIADDEEQYKLMFPTRKNLGLVCSHQTAAEALTNLKKLRVETILPKIIDNPDGSFRVIHPWDEEYREV